MAHVVPARPRNERSRVERALGTGRGVLIALVVTLALAGCLARPGGSASNGSTESGATVATQAATPQGIGIDSSAVVGAAVPAELTAYIKGKGGHAGIAVIDQTTGAAIAVNADRTFQTASIVKFDILATRLFQHQRDKTQMTANEKSLAFRMITESDNGAATALFGLNGGAAGMTAANHAFGLTATHVASAWGLTHTTPADQIRLLSRVMDPGGPISDANRAYILSLMSKVDPDQRWGVPDAADKTATGVYNKNGWDTMSAYGGTWGDNSIGRIVEPGHDWLAAVMSNYNHTDGAGHALDGTLATMAVGGLRLKSQLDSTH